MVQKRDNDYWKKHKGVPMPPVYGGTDGHIVALGGQWHPEIALHTTDFKTSGMESNGCIRLDDTEMEFILKEIPIGNFVVITN